MLDENMYSKRWTKEYSFANFSILNGDSVTTVIPDTTMISKTTVTTTIQGGKKKRVLSTQEKNFKKAVMVIKKLASVTAEQSKINFDKIIDYLENVYKLWSQG